MNELSIVRTFDDAEKAARAMSASGFFPDSKSAAQAIVKILAGQELGFGPFASMTGVNIIQGKPTLGANLLAAAIKRTGKYNYRVVEMTDQVCDLAFFEAGQEVGHSRFTMDDAKKAGLTGKTNWTAYPRNMLFARALSNGQRWYAPDVFNGATVYTPDELGAAVNEDGEIIDVKAVAVAEQEQKTEPATPTIPEALAHLAGVCNQDGIPYPLIDSATLSHMSRSIATKIAKNGLTPEAKEEAERKQSTIGEILTWRAANPAA